VHLEDSTNNVGGSYKRIVENDTFQNAKRTILKPLCRMKINH